MVSDGPLQSCLVPHSCAVGSAHVKLTPDLGSILSRPIFIFKLLQTLYTISDTGNLNIIITSSKNVQDFESAGSSSSVEWHACRKGGTWLTRGDLVLSSSR